MLVLVVVLVLDRLGFSVETRPEYSRTISFFQRDGERTRILEHEDEQEHEHDLLNFGIRLKTGRRVLPPGSWPPGNSRPGNAVASERLPYLRR